MRLRILGLVLLLFVLAPVGKASSDDAPAWLTQAASLKVPTYDKEVSAIVLVNEDTRSVNEDGRVTNVHSYAVRILRREARGRAVAHVGYIPDTGKVKDFHAWLIRENGTVKRYGKDDVLDFAGDDNDVYNEYRVKQISAKDDADAGTVFGYTYTTEDRSGFSQSDWAFQCAIPVISSRYTVVLPAGWRAEGVTFNHPKVEPSVNGTAYTWELTNLPPVPDEPLSPNLSNLVARLAVSYFPPAGQASSIKTFTNWSQVGAWMGELEDPQVIVDGPITSKALDLTKDAKSEYEKIQAIGSYVQNIRYISIQTGIGRGGGYRPHPAPQVFAKSYGDCKDKANLLRAMLKAVGITAFPVSIYSGDPEYVRADWPSPQQFNHCIIAIKVSDETRTATVIEHPKFGRLLIFDPTDTETPVGDLPFYLQGSLALIDSKDSEALVKMPVTPPEMNHLDRKTEMQLSADGSISGSIHERAGGQAAARFRTEFRNRSRTEYGSLVERWLSSGATAARIANIEATDHAADGRFALDFEFIVPGYAQLMQGRLLVFKPAIVARLESLALTASQRKHPVVINARSYSETVTVKLPAGFVVDEMPDPVKLDMPFGSFSTSYEAKDGQVVFKRSLVQRAMTIAPEQYATVRGFFEKIRAAESSPIVLAKQ